MNCIDLDRLGWRDEIHTVLSPFINLEHLTLGYDICQEEPAYGNIIAGLIHVWRNGELGYQNFARVKPAGIPVAHHATCNATEGIVSIPVEPFEYRS